MIKKHETFITVSNEKNVAVFVSSTVHDWKVRPDGGFDLSLTDEVKVSPGVVNLPPNGSATLRVSYLGKQEPVSQTGYRLHLKESPRLNMRDISDGVGANLMLTASMTLPVFVTPRAPLSDAFDKVEVKWRHGDKAEDGILLQVTNAGGRYVMAQTLLMDDRTVSTPAQYVLPGGAVASSESARTRLPWMLTSRALLIDSLPATSTLDPVFVTVVVVVWW